MMHQLAIRFIRQFRELLDMFEKHLNELNDIQTRSGIDERDR